MSYIGNVRSYPLCDIIETYCTAHLTVRVDVLFPVGKGTFFIENGEIVHAQLSEMRGADAVLEAMKLDEGDFSIELNAIASRRTVFTSWDRLIAEGKARKPGHSTQKSSLSDIASAGKVTEIVRRRLPDSGTTGALNLNLPVNSNSNLPQSEQKLQPEVVPKPEPTLSKPESPQPATAKIEDRFTSLTDSLMKTGVALTGVVLDEDNTIVTEVGRQNEGALNRSQMARAAFVMQGLESIVENFFALGACEGTLIEIQDQPMLVVRHNRMSCVLFPQPRIPVMQVINEIQRVLAVQTGGGQ